MNQSDFRVGKHYQSKTEKVFECIKLYPDGGVLFRTINSEHDHKFKLFASQYKNFRIVDNTVYTVVSDKR